MEPATLPPRFIYANEIRWQQSSDSSRCCGILFECRGHEAASGQESKWFDMQMKDSIRSLGWWCFGMLWDLVSFIRLWCWKITKILGWQWSDDAMKDNPRFFEMLGHCWTAAAIIGHCSASAEAAPGSNRFSTIASDLKGFFGILLRFLRVGSSSQSS